MRGLEEVTRNLRRAISADTVVLLVSVLVTIIVPRYLGVTEYGYWQVYLFYAGYVQIAQFGWSDGLLVRHAGRDVRVSGQASWFTSQLLFQVCVVIAVAGLLSLGTFLVTSSEAKFLVLAIAVNIVISNSRFMCLRLFQATRQMRHYSVNVAFDRLLYGALVLSLVLLGGEHFETLVICSLFSRLLALILAVATSRPFLTRKILFRRSTVKEAALNISSGLRTLLAVYAGTFTIGVVRLVVEREWGIQVFANVSLALHVASLVSLFVSGLSFAVLPYLRRAGDALQKRLYLPLRSVVSSVLVAALILYFPSVSLFTWWLPQYSLAVELLFVLFPVIVFEGRTALLTVTYLRSAHKETSLLVVSLFIVAFSTVISLFSAFALNNLIVTVGTILLAVTIKSVCLELVLLKHLGIQNEYRIVAEITVVVLFVVLTSTGTMWAFLPLLLAIALYISVLRRDITTALRLLKQPT